MSLKISRIAAITATVGAVGAMFVAAAPASAAGKLKLQFKNYVVSGYLTPRLLNEPVTLPQGSTFNGSTEIEVIELDDLHGTLTGTVAVPPFTAKLKLLGLIPTEVGLTFTQVGQPEGTIVSSPHSNCTGPGSTAGPGSQVCTLVTVPTKANLGITFLNASLGLPLSGGGVSGEAEVGGTKAGGSGEAGVAGEVGLGATTHCETAEPVTFHLSTYVTLLELITSGPQFAGTVTIPPIKCEGLEGIALGAALTAVMSGPENAYSLAIAPPKA